MCGHSGEWAFLSLPAVSHLCAHEDLGGAEVEGQPEAQWPPLLLTPHLGAATTLQAPEGPEPNQVSHIELGDGLGWESALCKQEGLGSDPQNPCKSWV